MILELIYNNDLEGVLKIIDTENLHVVDSFGDTPLHFAMLSANESITQLLLDKKVNVNAKNFQGKTALHYAVEEGNLILTKLLLGHSADISSEDNYGNQALWVAVFNASGGDLHKLPLVELLLKNGANVNHKNKSKSSPLEFATKVNFEPLVHLLRQYV